MAGVWTNENPLKERDLDKINLLLKYLLLKEGFDEDILDMDYNDIVTILNRDTKINDIIDETD